MPLAPVVLSVDPGHGGGANSSHNAIQAWKFDGKRYFLIDYFSKQGDAVELRAAFWSFMRKHNPSLALIENTANGPALIVEARRKARFEIKAVTPRRESKAARFHDHVPKIRRKLISAAGGILAGRIYLGDCGVS